MTFGLDTSVVLRLLTGQPQELAERALARYQEGVAAGDRFCVSDVVAAEGCLFLATGSEGKSHCRVKNRSDALRTLR